ncbi:MAG: hypothetical protein M3422_22045 [Actinomycetota bacterium]|nr:hypothetical protein [Actinomycetota bacterium]
MPRKTLNHPDPDKYYYDVKGALDDFESALKDRMWDDYERGYATWTPEGYKELPQGAQIDDYNRARDSFRDSTAGWAKDVRDDVDGRIAEYHTQNLSNIDFARDGLLRATKLLGGSPGAPGRPGRLPGLVDDINSRCGLAADYMAWSGTSADNVQNHFGVYVQDTMVNQASIAGRLVNLYTGRSNIVEYVRNNVLHYIQTATAALKEEEPVTPNANTVLGVNVGAMAVGFATGPVGVVTEIALLAGEYLEAQDPTTVPVHEIEDVVVSLRNQLDALKETAQSNEETWTGKVQAVQGEIAGITNNAYLELYDFTGKSTPGDASSAPSGGFDVRPGSIEELAGWCFDAAAEYEGVIGRVIETDVADNDLMGMNHVVTNGDIETKDIRDALLGFLRTTCARYHEAGIRLAETAKTYWDVEFENESVLAGLRDDVDLNGRDRGGNGMPAGRALRPTNRDDINDIGEEAPYNTDPNIPNEPYEGPQDDGCRPGDAYQQQPQYDGDPVTPVHPAPADPNDRDGDGAPDTIDIDGGDGTGEPRV